jgi:hypothetical protein
MNAKRIKILKTAYKRGRALPESVEFNTDALSAHPVDPLSVGRR